MTCTTNARGTVDTQRILDITLCKRHEITCTLIPQETHTNGVSLCIELKGPCDQKINSYFSLDFKTMLTKHKVTHVLSLDFKRHLFILTVIFLFKGPPLLTLCS